ncbi:rod shape-determining protein [Patescibacteria group bacterium]|nr:rod shape-determining protein [Patescibacteria group bacterium]
MFGRNKSTVLKRDRAFSVLDIGTEFVKALTCEVEGQDLKVLGYARVRQNRGEMESGTITDIAGVIEKSDQALKEAERMAGTGPNQIVLGVSGEIVKGATSMISYKRRDPSSKVHQEELKNIIHKVQWKAFEKVRGDLAYETGFNEIDVKLIHAAIVDIKIDGYKVSNPIGFQGREITMSVFNAFSPLVHFGALQTISAELDRELMAIMAEPYAVGRLLGGTELQGYSGIFLDIGGGTTDIIVVQDGSTVGTKMFTIGGRAFTKRLAHELNISQDEAEEVKTAFSNKQLEHQSFKIVGKALESDAKVWLSGVYLTLQEFFEIDSLPPTLYLCGGGSMLPMLKEGLELGDWAKRLPFPRKPQVKYLLPKQISHIKDHTNRLKSPADITPMALANVGMEILAEEKSLTKMLQKVVRLMQV